MTSCCDQWNVAASTLEIMHKLLSNHEVKVEDFVDEPCVDFVQPGSTTVAVMSKPPGHTILVHLTSDSATLKTVSLISDSVVIFAVKRGLCVCDDTILL